MASIKINGVTYRDIYEVYAETRTDNGAIVHNRYILINGDPGALRKEASVVTINGVRYEDPVSMIRVPLADGSGNYAMYLRASEYYDRVYEVAPGEAIAQGDFVKLVPLYPGESAYPREDLYPNGGTLLKGMGGNSNGADGVALASGSAETRIKIYRPPA